LHAAGKLTLTQIAAFAKITHRTRHLKAVIFCDGFFRLSGELRNEPFRFFDFERFVAAPTKRIRGAKLNQSAAFTP
jgi:hypothetical protein